jgi:hypothetical protein
LRRIRETGKQMASNGAARGRWCQQRTYASPGAGNYCNQTTGRAFLVGSRGQCHAAGGGQAAYMPRAVHGALRGYARQPRQHNASLHTQFDQAVQEVVVVAAELQALEAHWGFVPGRRRR